MCQDPPADTTDTVNDSDSTYSASLGSSTTSVGDSIREYRKLHGRTYHHEVGKAEYWGPNDEKQNDNLDIGHHLFTLVLKNKLYLAPLKNPQKVLDIGTGTGIWALDFADENPQAEVIGVDISPIQPTWVAPNVRFQIDDAGLDWTFQENTFDYIHLRHMTGSFDNWPHVFEQAFKCTKPGGYIEHMDFDIRVVSDNGIVGPGHPMYEWSMRSIDAGEKMGRTFDIATKSKALIEAAGYVDVVETIIKIPVGTWMKDKESKVLGAWSLLFLNTGVEGFSLYLLTSVLGWSIEETQVFLATVRKEFPKLSNQGYYTAHCIYGRKPGGEDTVVS
ncbi:S-adenosyl-L-methionine-dependent methyltransferase [Leptodontidium sp. MPI-SDFR-AT-0119]|nr:S-adenosyl-L-methionine-dependent methyltransferase [Leptodontidium sp. MPI-SDFR-AT-0119]